MDSTQTVVDGYASIYMSLKSFIKYTGGQITNGYHVAKSGAESFEHMALLPVRDYVILPLFTLTEHTITFITSPALASLCSRSLEIVENHSPFGVGKVFISPALRTSWGVASTTAAIMQYPIPSQQTVASVTLKAVDNTKWGIRVVGREVRLDEERSDERRQRT